MQLTDQAEPTIQAAYEYFHQALFDGRLPPCRVFFQVTVDRNLGFRPDPERGGASNAIVLHIGFFKAVPPAKAMQMLVHEMAHAWQFHFGDPPEGHYHNGEFAAKSISIGLMPSSTGGVSGHRTGAAVIDYVIRGGKFERAVPAVVSMWEAVFPVSALKSIAVEPTRNFTSRSLRRLP